MSKGRSARILGTLAAGVAAGLMLAVGLAQIFPHCLRGPYSALDPVLLATWIDAITEALPLATSMLQDPVYPLAIAVPVGLALIVVGWKLATSDPRERLAWVVYGAFLLLAAETPITADTPRAAAPDAVIVAARDFLPALEPLIQQRQRQGHRLALVPAGQSAEATRRAIRQVAADAGGNLKFVLLVGDSKPQPAADPRLAARNIPAHLHPAEVEMLTLPDELRDELGAAESAGTPIAAALAEGMPVSFCYAGSVTESLWDVSIDTLEPWRRRGYAARAARFEIARLLRFGRRPVWGAVESNAGSLGLASRLGFVPVDAVWLFTTPPARPAA